MSNPRGLPTLLNKDSQRGFSLIEMAVAIVVLAILATAFISAFSSVMRTSASPLQTSVMEDIAASQLDYLLSGSFQSAVAASSFTIPISGGFDYWAVISGQYSVVSEATVTSGQYSVVSGTTVTSGIHLTVNVYSDADTAKANLCMSCVSLSGDTFDVQ